jgi:hypothetical protein
MLQKFAKDAVEGGWLIPSTAVVFSQRTSSITASTDV